MVNGVLVKTTAGEAAVKAAKTIVSYKFEESTAPKMSNFVFHFNDGKGIAVNNYFGSSQKVVNGVVHPRTGTEVVESIINDFYIKLKSRFVYLTSVWDISSEGSEVIFTSKRDESYDNAVVVIPEKDNRAEIKGEFLKKQAGSEGSAGVKQVNTLKITGAIIKAGNVVVTFEEGIEKVEKTIEVLKADTRASIAAKIAKEFSGLSGWDVTNAKGVADVVFTSKTANADKDLNITFTNN